MGCERSFMAGSSASSPFLCSRWSSGTMKGDRMPFLLWRNPIHTPSISIFFCISKWSLFDCETFSSMLPDPSGCTTSISFCWIDKEWLPSLLWGHSKNISRYSIVAQSSLPSSVPLHERGFPHPPNLFFRLQIHLHLKNFPNNYTKLHVFNCNSAESIVNNFPSKHYSRIKMKILFKRSN